MFTVTLKKKDFLLSIYENGLIDLWRIESDNKNNEVVINKVFASSKFKQKKIFHSILDKKLLIIGYINEKEQYKFKWFKLNIQNDEEI